MEHNKVEKPPIGLTPKWVSEKERFIEVCGAITRYYNSGLEIPIGWVEEYNLFVSKEDKENISEFQLLKQANNNVEELICMFLREEELTTDIEILNFFRYDIQHNRRILILDASKYYEHVSSALLNVFLNRENELGKECVEYCARCKTLIRVLFEELNKY